jgi:hypothetical protein
MPAGEDVTEVGWEPSNGTGNGAGDVTIEHRAMDAVKAPMTREDAGRLADRMFGNHKSEIRRPGSGAHWVRRSEPDAHDKAG